MVLKPLATSLKTALTGGAVFGLIALGMPGAYASASGPVVVPPTTIGTPTAAEAYTVVPAHCQNGQNIEGTVTAHAVTHAQSRIGGELATSYSGYGQVSLEFIADPGYTFANGLLVSIAPSPDLGSVQNCTPPDTDKDGVADAVDQCPATPAGSVVDANGCADSQKDSDGDHVVDSIDKCPGTLMGTQVDVSGCALPTVKYVTPVAPTVTDHTVTIPESTGENEGVVYTNGDGVVLAAGTYGVFQRVGPYHVDANGNLTVLARPANDTYVLTGLAHYMWPFHFGLPVPADTIHTLRVTICHGDQAITVFANDIVHDHVGLNGEQESAHASHPEDTIPGFPYIENGVAHVFAGLNDDAAGEARLMNGCVTEHHGGDDNSTPENPAPGNNSTPGTQVPPVDTVTPVVVSKPATPQAPVTTSTTVTDTQSVVSTNVDSSIQASGETESQSTTGFIADAKTAADGDLQNWLLLVAGLSLMIVAIFHKKVLRQS